jgi:hypothetical protein
MLPAIAISIFAFGVLERDGVWTIAGLIMSAISLFVAAGVVYALLKAVFYLIANALH